ncbi:MAG: glutamyl-tRNA amidotransferase [gamma proteobacterium symbiont of Ctena orbiculata]|uniref:GatB/YqeY domain-containing protein n=1 Tax=Candidatus Thiodiazotropha taylori TaxID=2792791 RepID=A0A944M9X2_9GAMM|nr:GatB/YqeY domain-containing protein [Candidatus Thiodiazotropha taylori]PUB88992.1 MAG: glutamyl-tRNA amidotransferase [gamma proteobacterium symbiont of Ctena orbiculata]MBT2988028.1 GatB/YqeY domain-containing protein [Candidatus Thiodiazotropha taylori]MBT2997665.1 GatB/YqeY domain-containing protein [Candidatus Thiodiazotropha taylori]MBT3001914.1 GatB/YqeY domain-containing protein [Candidatus Thiodiazotropha taylori]
MLKAQILDDVKQAMKAKEKARLGTLRLITAAIKQREVDERSELDDTQVLAILEKMIKQRRDSIKQYEDAGRQELADQEKSEIAIIEAYMPAGLSEEEIAALIAGAIAETNASGMKDMGKVMGLLKPQMQGRADMGKVSGLVKQKLST